MSYPTKLILQAQQTIDNRRFQSGMKTTAHYEEIRSKYPEANKILIELSTTTDKLAKLIIEHDDDIKEKIEALKNENLAMQEKLAGLLVQNGYPVDYLDDSYFCDKCEDTGYCNGERCECFKELLKQLASKSLSDSLPLGLTDFDTFDLNMYSDTPRAEIKGLSARTIMQKNYDECKKYAENFHLPYEGIFMTGATGLGKTHLSLSIARKVVDSGYSAIYGSVPDLFRKIEDVHFGRNTENGDVMQSLKECDLLVLDDLGAEFDTPFYISCLYDIVNTRQYMGKPTIVSTNLTTSEIKERYSDRIASRLLSMKCLIFCGDDIRIKLKQNK